MVNKQTNQIASLINLFSLLQTEAQNVTYYNRTRNQRIGDARRILAHCFYAAKAKVFVSCLSVIFKLVTLLRSRNLRAVVIHRAMPVESNNTPVNVFFIVPRILHECQKIRVSIIQLDAFEYFIINKCFHLSVNTYML